MRREGGQGSPDINHREALLWWTIGIKNKQVRDLFGGLKVAPWLSCCLDPLGREKLMHASFHSIVPENFTGPAAIGGAGKEVIAEGVGERFVARGAKN